MSDPSQLDDQMSVEQIANVAAALRVGLISSETLIQPIIDSAKVIRDQFAEAGFGSAVSDQLAAAYAAVWMNRIMGQMQ